MKRNVVCTRLVNLFFLALLTSWAPAAHAANCSAAMLAGNWDYTYTGTIFTANGPLPLAAVGHYSQDSTGNVSGSQVRSVAGDSGVENISGTVSVNRDCTALATIGVYANGQLLRTGEIALVFDGNGKHTRGIFQSLTLPDGTNIPVVITLEGNKVSSSD
jgi:hypothetical protein